MLVTTASIRFVTVTRFSRKNLTIINTKKNETAVVTVMATRKPSVLPFRVLTNGLSLCPTR